MQEQVRLAAATRTALENRARLVEQARIDQENRTADANQQNLMGNCRHNNLSFFNPTTQDEVNSTFCDMQERDPHKAFQSTSDHSRICNNCFAIICNLCYTDVDPYSSNSDRDQ